MKLLRSFLALHRGNIYSFSFPPPRPGCRLSDREVIKRRCCRCCCAAGPEYFILIAAHCQTLLVFAAKTALTHAVSQGRRSHSRCRRRHFVALRFGEHFERERKVTY